MSSVHDPLLEIEGGMGKFNYGTWHDLISIERVRRDINNAFWLQMKREKEADYGKLINIDRRRFLIVSVFDLCFTTLLWLICTVTKGNDWPAVFLREINIFAPYFLQNSLFDLVIVAFLRMTLILFFYAIMLVSHWLPVAGTTTITTLFLVVKVLFFFSKSQGNLPQYLVILSSFVIAWFELWLVPFRVLPRERRNIIAQAEETTVIRAVRSMQTDDEFRSAMEFSSGSDAEEDKIPRFISNGEVFSKERYISAANSAIELAKMRLSEISTWKVLSKGNPHIRFLESKRIYYLSADIMCSAESLFRAVWKDNKLWNKQLLDSKVILHIDPSTEVVHSISAPALRGYISSRDFLDVRKTCLDTENIVYEGFYVSVDSSILPPLIGNKIVRGQNGPNMLRISASPSNSCNSILEWLIDSDLKGNIPKRLIERTMCSFLYSYVENLRLFLRERVLEYP